MIYVGFPASTQPTNTKLGGLGGDKNPSLCPDTSVAIANPKRTTREITD
ncbi:hypothetical protein PCC7424_1244 [Gloeothece citriformis PCC 7424]|uniref:Uncharacterized protein n=1 Tax=Gloeothece citriformis (strain PCC 7424) TaxID=65393 RepID=B7K7C3_GLOC7|nr:hypothetical protein [Gloeothece citriformis]ACK69691.1 hypothetical protein PCC7424_1244 [Gloeothece citriformis PCC 7424]